ncbi:MAG: TIGR02391 family protein [Bryobacterales bacterium]|nr:TIGR02391 family protein [Bryobacterales bacterium]
MSELEPDPRQLLQLQPDELGAYILVLLNQEPSWAFERASLCDELLSGYTAPGDAIYEALGEALNWLECSGCMAVRPPIPTHDRTKRPPELHFVTRRGKQASGIDGLRTLRQSLLLPPQLLHPRLRDRCYSSFSRAEYDTSVFLAFKFVEVEVRRASGLPDTTIGVSLMNEAFHRETGPLTPMGAAVAEREAVRNLFAGAIGHAKNPHSHREEPVTPEDAAHLLTFASYLLRLVDILAAERAVSS